jgi:serine/threonine-protein kinase HipA
VYEPEYEPEYAGERVDLDSIALNVQEVLEGSSSDVLKQLLALNGSSAGARPKALIGVSENFATIVHGKSEDREGFEPWLVKFPIPRMVLMLVPLNMSMR